MTLLHEQIIVHLIGSLYRELGDQWVPQSMYSELLVCLFFCPRATVIRGSGCGEALCRRLLHRMKFLFHQQEFTLTWDGLDKGKQGRALALGRPKIEIHYLSLILHN